MSLEIKNKLQSYDNEALKAIFKCSSKTNLSPEQIEMLFEDLKKFLFISYLVERKAIPLERFILTEELALLDQMWHQFILMTNDYQRFCQDIFGVFLHHEPSNPSDESIKILPNIRSQIEVLKEVWGIQTVNRWYLFYPQLQSSKQSIWNKIRKIYAE